MCTIQQRGEFLRLGVGEAKAEYLCSQYNVSSLGAQSALLSHLYGAVEQQAVLQKNTTESINTMFLLFSAYLVFVMQAGFAMLCVGAVRSKNSVNIIFNNLSEACLGALVYYLVGHSFAFGEDTLNGFIGSGNYALSQVEFGNNTTHSFSFFIFQWAFAAACATIMAGAVAERIRVPAYMGYTVLMSGLVYPVVSHWVWCKHGWLSAANPNPLFGSGAIDFAGSGVVHLTGGLASFIAAYILGARVGRFDTEGKPVNFGDTNSTVFTALGTYLLWFGWYGFNPGSAITISGPTDPILVSRTAVNSTLASGAGGVAAAVVFFLRSGHSKKWDTMMLCNGALCGLAAVTGGSGVYHPYAAIICGGMAGVIFIYCDYYILHRIKVDDVVAACSMHMCCGMHGLLFTGFFAVPEFVQQLYGVSSLKKAGIFYGGTGHLLACQIVELITISAWVGVTMFAYFKSMSMANLLRVDVEKELAGLDASKYGMLTTNDLGGALGAQGGMVSGSMQMNPSKAGSGGFGNSSYSGARKGGATIGTNTNGVVISGAL